MTAGFLAAWSPCLSQTNLLIRPEKAPYDFFKWYVRCVPSEAKELRRFLEESEQAGTAGDTKRQKTARMKFALVAAALAHRREEVYRVGVTNLASLSAEQRAVWDVARGIVDAGEMSSQPEYVLSKDPRVVLGRIEKEEEAIAGILGRATRRDGSAAPKE